MEAEYYQLFNNATTIYKSPPSSPHCAAKPIRHGCRVRHLRARSPAEGFWRGGNLHTKVPGAMSTSFYNARQQTWEHSNNLVHHYKNLARINGGLQLPTINKKKRRRRKKRARSKRGQELTAVELEVQTRQLAPSKPTERWREKLPDAPSRNHRTEARYWSPTQSSANKRQSKHKSLRRNRRARGILQHSKPDMDSQEETHPHRSRAAYRKQPRRKKQEQPDASRAFKKDEITPWSTGDSLAAPPTIRTVDGLLKGDEKEEEDPKYELDGFEKEQDYAALRPCIADDSDIEPFAEPVSLLSEESPNEQTKRPSMGANTNVATRNEGSTLDTYTLTLTAEDV